MLDVLLNLLDALQGSCLLLLFTGSGAPNQEILIVNIIRQTRVAQ